MVKTRAQFFGFCSNPRQQKVKYLGINALPFGAIGSVSSFEGINGSTVPEHRRAQVMLDEFFFDDYTLLSRRVYSKSAAVSAECLFQLLGIAFATEGKKRWTGIQG